MTSWVHSLHPEQITGSQIITEFKPGKKTFSAVEEIQRDVITKIEVNGDEQPVYDNTAQLEIDEQYTNQDGSDIEVISGDIYMVTTDGIAKLTITGGYITGYDINEAPVSGKVITEKDGRYAQDWLRMV